MCTGRLRLHNPVVKFVWIAIPRQIAFKYIRVPTALGKREMAKKNPWQGIWKFCQNTGNLVCSSCKFADSRVKRYFDICRGYFLFLMRWVFMHIALKGCSPPHTNEPVQFWIGFGLVLIGGSGLNPLGLLTPHWIIQLVIDRNAIENV